MDSEKLNAMSDEAMVHRELQLERDLLQAKFRHKTGQLDDSSALLKLRRDIARSRTVQRSREKDQGLRKNALRDMHRSSFKPGVTVVETAAAGASGFLKGIASKLGIGDKTAEGDE